MQSDAAKLIEAIERHYEYLGKVPNASTRDTLNASKVKNFTRDIGHLMITSDDDGIMLQNCVECGTWTEVPRSDTNV